MAPEMAQALGILKFCTWMALGSLLLALLYALLFGKLDTRGLLIDKHTRSFSIARLQLVGTSIVVSAIYLDRVITSPCGPKLPELDETLIAAALSGGAYGIAKLDSTLRVSTAPSLLQTILAGQQRRS